MNNITFKNITLFIKNNWLCILLIIIFHILFFRYNISNNSSIKTLMQFYGSCAFILSIISIYIQLNNQNINMSVNEVNYFNNIIDTINLNIYNYFNSNKNMEYYYLELYYNSSNYTESNRNKYLEKLISNKILSDIDSIINYIDSFKILHPNSFQILVAEEKIINLLKLFFKSKIFKENWIFFKENIALEWTKEYIELNIL